MLVDDIDADPKRFEDAVAKAASCSCRELGGTVSPSTPIVCSPPLRPFPAARSGNGVEPGRSPGPQPGRGPERRAERSRIKTAVTPDAAPLLATRSLRCSRERSDDDIQQFARPPQEPRDARNRLPLACWSASQSIYDTLTLLSPAARSVGHVECRCVLSGQPSRQRPPQSIIAERSGVETCLLRARTGPSSSPNRSASTPTRRLSAGYRGLVFQGDAELTRNSGRINLIEMSLLNAEIDLV